MLPLAEQVFDHLHLYDMATLAFTVREVEKKRVHIGRQWFTITRTNECPCHKPNSTNLRREGHKIDNQ